MNRPFGRSGALALSFTVVAGLMLGSATSTWAQAPKTNSPAEPAAKADADPSAAPAPADKPAETAKPATPADEEQNTASDDKPTGDAKPTESAKPTDSAKTDDAAATDDGETSDDGTTGEKPATSTASEEDNAETAETVEGEQAAAEDGEDNQGGISPLVLALIVIAVIGIPWWIGAWLSKRLKMEDHGWKMSATLFSLVAAVVITIFGWPPKLGPDLSGGINLIYEVDPSVKEVDLDKLIQAVTRRINPGGIKEVTIRKYGERQIEIIIPKADAEEVRKIERSIITAGALEFRITANPEDHGDIITMAEESPAYQVMKGGYPEGEWVGIDEKQFESLAGFTTRKNARGETEVLVVIDDYNVNGGQLSGATAGIDQAGRPAVNFTFNSAGTRDFGLLTSENAPEAGTGRTRRLGIVLDKTLLSAPQLNEAIVGGRGQISGGKFTNEDVEFLISILNAGSLPAALNKTPISKQETSPTLGRDTVEMGSMAMAGSMVVVVVFMLIYYRFAGVVACLALAANIVLILAVMILVKAAFTLPGLAGLVLTVGMAVDANVLIFERIREEIDRGAAIRMAIRNGFSRATTTIIDANLTTLITAVVLFWIGTDQIKGFAVTLILGIVMSMYTAIFCSRIVFDVWERQRWLTKLTMMRLVGGTSIDFIGKRYAAALVSLVVIAVGMAGVVGRGKNLLDIDFVGGVSVTIAFNEPHDIAQVREKVDQMVEQLELDAKAAREASGENGSEASESESTEGQSLADVQPDIDVSVVGVGSDEEEHRDREYRIDVSVRNLALIERRLEETFAGELRTASMKFTPAKPAGDQARVETRHSTPPVAVNDRADRVPESNLAGSQVLDLSGTQFVALLAQSTDAQTAPPDAKPKSDEPAVAKPTVKEPAAEKSTAEKPATEKPAEAKPAAEEPDSEKPDSEKPKPPESSSTAPGEKPPPAAKTDSAQTPGTKNKPARTVLAKSTSTLTFGEPIKYNTLVELLDEAFVGAQLVRVPFEISNVQHVKKSDVPQAVWELTISTEPANADNLLSHLQTTLGTTTVFPSASMIGGRVAGDTQVKAGYALFASLLFIVGYIWLRFQRVMFGLAAVVALVHDVLVTLGVIALSAYVVQFLPFVASWMLIDPFKISLPIVAAFLTIIGYSLNDTIVVFDRIREVRGKSPDLTESMVNASINQTLSRTLLTSLTTLIVVVILYFRGGPGIHGFAFSLVVGVMVGTYSSIFVASPVLLWMAKPSGGKKNVAAKPAETAAAS